MRLRPILALLVSSSVVAHFAGCVDDSALLAPTSDASPDDANVPLEASATSDANGAVNAPSPHDSAIPDAPAEAEAPDDAGAGDASDASASDAADASDATIVDASDAATLDASDAAADANDASAVVGQALQFDGVQDLVIMPTVDGGANEAAFTTEIWFNTTSGTGSLFEVYGGGGADRFLVIESGAVCFYVFGSPTTLLCSPTATYADGAWHHAAGTLGVVNGMCLYVDGTLAASQSTPTSSAFNYDTNFRLGYGHTDLNSTLVYFGGKLDEARVWSIERSASDILANYKTHLSGTTAGLQGYWKLDETGAATTAADSTPNGNDGVLTGFSFTPSPWVAGGAF